MLFTFNQGNTPNSANIYKTDLQLITNYLNSHSGISENIIERGTPNVPVPVRWGWCVAMVPYSTRFRSTSFRNSSSTTDSITKIKNPKKYYHQIIHYQFTAAFFLYYGNTFKPPKHPSVVDPLYIAKNSFYFNHVNDHVICDNYASYSKKVFSWIAINVLIDASELAK